SGAAMRPPVRAIPVPDRNQDGTARPHGCSLAAKRLIRYDLSLPTSAGELSPKDRGGLASTPPQSQFHGPPLRASRFRRPFSIPPGQTWLRSARVRTGIELTGQGSPALPGGLWAEST